MKSYTSIGLQACKTRATITKTGFGWRLACLFSKKRKHACMQRTSSSRLYLFKITFLLENPCFENMGSLNCLDQNNPP